MRAMNGARYRTRRRGGATGGGHYRLRREYQGAVFTTQPLHANNRSTGKRVARAVPLGHFAPAYLSTQRGFDTPCGHYNGALDYFTHDRDCGPD